MNRVKSRLNKIASKAVLLLLVTGVLTDFSVSTRAEDPKRDGQPRLTASGASIAIDGQFDDWESVPGHKDAADDQNDTDGRTPDYKPIPRKNPDVDILEYRLTHNDENLFAYVRARGQIGRTQKGDEKQQKKAGRYYITLAIDVDQNDETGYKLWQGGTHPSSDGYDVNAEIEWFDGAFNTGMYMNKCCQNDKELAQAFLDQSQNRYKEGKDGPYPAGFMRIGPGIYKFYSQWVYHDDGTITFVRDRGPVVHGILVGATSKDGHELEMRMPLRGFLVDQNGDPVIGVGKPIDVSFSLISSGELAPDKEWSSDAAEPINAYELTPLKPR